MRFATHLCVAHSTNRMPQFARGAAAVVGLTLTFDEQEARWTESDGQPRNVPGCVAVLGLANSDWAAVGPAGLQRARVRRDRLGPDEALAASTAYTKGMD